ncbi:MAG TPA: glycoside hydrolase family 2 TIM barrel-domain containing protein [Parafilimonas sp.]|nr:glycoside hydrolase family 2 TIM barrel-domain containing protein [Parafilimonas sp.]
MTRILLSLLIQFTGLFVCAQTNSIDGFAIPRLSPKPFTVTGVQTPQLSLNGEWNFQISTGKNQSTIQVPGEWEMQGFTVNEGETAVYTKALNIPADWKNKKIKLRFDGVSSHAIVKVNGTKVGEHEGSFVPFEADITSALKASNNILQVEVQANTISDKLACTSQYAVHTVGGLLRNVTMFVLPQANIENLIVNTTFDKQYKNATLQLTTTIERGDAVSLRYTLKDAAGKVVLQKTQTVNQPQLISNIPVKTPQQWNPEHPYLYELTTELLQHKKVVETIKQKVGFRQVEVKGNILLVNGKPVKLRGVCRHSIYPLTGRSVADSLDVKDAVLFREGNCNYIRTSHYPPTETFLNACDSLGLFVESESSLCWINHGASPIWKLWNYKDEKFLPYMVAANVEKMVAERNHPSIIIWSLGNESVWSDLWNTVNQVAKKLDPSRPTTFHDQCWGGFNNAGSKADIAVYHYPGINGPAACDTMNRPVLFGEYAHISCYSRRELVTDPGVRAGYGAPLTAMYDSMYHHNACLGGAIWAAIDDIFHMPDGRIVGYGPWGPLDAWRRPKPEYYGMKQAYSPIKVTLVESSSPGKNVLQLSVENRFDFTNCKNINITCNIDGVEKNITADIAPHGNGIINIAIDVNAKEVLINFYDPRGFIAQQEKIVLKYDEPVVKKDVAVTLTENDASVTVAQGDVTYLISKLTGIILSANKNDKLILKQGPVFGIVPMNDEDGGKPNVAGETYQNNIYPLKNYSLYTLFAKNFSAQSTEIGIKVSMDVTYYGGSRGKQSYLFAKDGTVTTEYEVQYKGADTLPRQYGLMMQLPKSYDELSWKRKGDFSSYPSNDIARTEGSAMLHAKHTEAVEPWRVVPTVDWKDDANGLGSNDFRSTKQNIYTVSLTDKDNNGIEVIAGTTQSSRSWLQDEAIQLLIADYNNNGSEPFYGSPFTNGRISIKNKTLKGKIVFRIK